MVLIRHFTGLTPDGVEHIMMITVGITAPPEVLAHADRLGVQALQHKISGIRDVAPVGDGWTEYDMQDPEDTS